MSQNKGRDINFTQGSIVKTVTLFALPIMAGELLQNLYGSVDTLVVGNFVGATALAAVGVCGTLSNLLIGFFNGMAVGCTVVIARIFGRGDTEQIAPAIRYTFTFSVLLGVLLSAAGIALSPWLLHISGANDEIFAEALSYLRVYLAGLMFTVMYNCGAGILRATGDSRSPFVILSVSSVLNIILDLLFVAAFSWGTVGVGVATVISQGVSVFLIARRIRQRACGRCIDVVETVKNGRPTVKDVLGIGLSAGVQGAMINFSNLFVWRYINRFSTAAVAGVSVAQRLDKFVVLPAKAWGQAATAFTGQNAGAEDYARIKKGARQILLLSLGSFALVGAVMYPWANEIASLFNRDPDVLVTATLMIRTLIPLYALISLREVLLGVLRGSGKSTMPMILSLVGMVGLRQIYLAAVSRLTTDIAFIIYGFPVGWGSASILLLIYYFCVRKKIHLA